ncbi:hypothetical protein [Fuerstiella marisgermanici]|uniref:Uncharacterized protein n=1 Tax=Fuerstiella marisgermanici TaxID=1891926 RepID=A0A1P8WK75_9PLAN|nr:hypothetical protein [Fuerstiella marisgermanici]APZ94464.1 hypothetical protein Fuma_04096 [Fuerstiella marisgermanici]
MSIQKAEELKQKWTDKYVSVLTGVAELRRFEGLVGQVKTVNMNCRLLVQFDTPADISWYDIDPEYLQIAAPKTAAQNAPTATEKPQTAATGSGRTPQKSSPGAKSKSAAQASGASSSPLDAIRKQAASTPKSPPPAGTATKPAASPLDAIRRQNAGTAATAEAPKPAKAKSSAGASPLDTIRSQNAGSPLAAKAPQPLADTPATVAKNTGGSPLDQIRKQASAASEPPASKTAAPKSGSPLDQIRSQAAAGTAQGKDSASADAESPKKSKTEPTNAAAQQVSSPATPEAPSTETTAKASAKSAAEILNLTTPQPVPKSAASTPLDQIRSQAGEEPGTGAATVFDQVRAQAASEQDASPVAEQGGAPANPLDDTAASSGNSATSDLAGDEDPVKQTFRGKKLPKQDDLKIVEGIGPKIEELFHAANINTWQALAAAEPERLSQILKDAGPRFQMHTPDTWPHQAQLAAEGKWQELEQYQDHLDGGRSARTDGR